MTDVVEFDIIGGTLVPHDIKPNQLAGLHKRAAKAIGLRPHQVACMVTAPGAILIGWRTGCRRTRRWRCGIR